MIWVCKYNADMEYDTGNIPGCACGCDVDDVGDVSRKRVGSGYGVGIMWAGCMYDTIVMQV